MYIYSALIEEKEILHEIECNVKYYEIFYESDNPDILSFKKTLFKEEVIVGWAKIIDEEKMIYEEVYPKKSKIMKKGGYSNYESNGKVIKKIVSVKKIK